MERAQPTTTGTWPPPMYATPGDERQAQLRQTVASVLTIEAVKTGDKEVAFTGQLRGNADQAFYWLQPRLNALGYTPVLRRGRDGDEVLAVEGVITGTRSNWLINVILFFLTVASVFFVGMQIWSPLGAIVFTVGLLGVLGVHEFGHYIVAQMHGMAVTLPYFIPLPIPPLGTLGAFIRLKSPIWDRKALFDMAVAGPLAGFFIALPIFMLGLLLPWEWLRPLLPSRPMMLIPLAESRLVEFLVDILRPGLGRFDLFRNPLTAVGWFGMLVTALNLLPAGQLDGGHIAYAVFGRWARPLAVATFVALIALGWLYWPGWYIWAFMLLLTGLSHPSPLNDITRLDPLRLLLALFCVVLFMLIIALQPFPM